MELERNGVPERAYSLSGGNRPERYCIDEGPDGWSVYYSEKGNRNDEVVLATEDEACRKLLEWVLADDSVMGR